MTISLLLASLSMQAMPSPDLPRWRVVGRNSAGEYSIDPNNLRWRGRRVTVYVRLRMNATAERPASTGVMRYVYDCAANTVRSELTDLYDEDGNFVRTAPRANPEDVPISEDSPNSETRDYLCTPGT